MTRPTHADPDDGRTAFAPMYGHWTVRHRRLQKLFADCSEWRAFPGTSSTAPVLAGNGNIEDNWLDDPIGAYRAIAVRSFDPQSARWRIWWLDERRQAIDPPVSGHLVAGRGSFTGADAIDGRDILVRFDWNGIGTASPRWEQAFSRDGGKSWETNWTMDFSRA